MSLFCILYTNLFYKTKIVNLCKRERRDEIETEIEEITKRRHLWNIVDPRCMTRKDKEDKAREIIEGDKRIKELDKELFAYKVLYIPKFPRLTNFLNRIKNICVCPNGKD